MRPNAERRLLRRLGIIFILSIAVGFIAFAGVNMSHTKSQDEHREANGQDLIPG